MKRHQTNKAEILLGPKKGDHLEWTNKKLSPENNPRNAGRQSAVYISSTGGPTSYTKSNSKKNKKQKKLQANSQESGQFAKNAKISAFITYIRNTLDETDKKTHFCLGSLLELKAYFGIFYMRAALHLNRMDFDIVYISKVVILYLFVQCS